MSVRLSLPVVIRGRVFVRLSVPVVMRGRVSVKLSVPVVMRGIVSVRLSLPVVIRGRVSVSTCDDCFRVSDCQYLWLSQVECPSVISSATVRAFARVLYTISLSFAVNKCVTRRMAPDVFVFCPIYLKADNISLLR